MRKHYIDNLRWAAILLLIPYHAAMAWNTWGEPNYIRFEGSRPIISLVVFCSAFLMPLMFLLAGMSTRFALGNRGALQSSDGNASNRIAPNSAPARTPNSAPNSAIARTPRQYLAERVRRLLVPLVFGTVVLMPILTFLADKFNNQYNGTFLEHYQVFFTKYTDLTGADGGFSLGQFWFLLYLFVISCIALGMILLVSKFSPREKDSPRARAPLPLWTLLCMGLPLPFLSEVLSIGGKSLAEFLYIFLLGYYVFSRKDVIAKLRRRGALFLTIGVLAGIANVYLFVWSAESPALLNQAAKFVAEWFTILGLLGAGSAHFDFKNKVTGFFARRSFAIFSLHYVFVVTTQYLLADAMRDYAALNFLVPVVLSYGLTFLATELAIRVPVLAFLLGVKGK